MKARGRRIMRQVDTIRRAGRERTMADTAREQRRYPAGWCGAAQCGGHSNGGSCR